MRMVSAWLVTFTTAAMVALTLGLGFWQWGRAQQKLAVQAAIEQQAMLPPLDARALRSQEALHALLHRRMVLRGEWLAQHTIFLDNRQMNGRVGFFVLTPLRLEGGGASVLVQRGWVPRNFTRREQLPPVHTPAGVIEVRGRLAPPPAKLYAFDTRESGPIRQNVELSQLRLETGLPLLSLSVQQTGDASEGLLRDWPSVSSGAQRNYGYAFQWWALSGLIAILYVWFQFVAPRRKARPV